MPKIGEFLFGKKEDTKQTQLYTPQQQQFFDTILGKGKEGISSGMDYLMQLLSGEEGAFDAFEAPLRSEYEQQTIPDLAERFSALNAQSSSAFGQSLGGAAGSLTENLAALREGLKTQALSQLQGITGMGTGQQFSTQIRPQTGGFIGGMAPGFGASFGEAAGQGAVSGANSAATGAMDWMAALMA